MASVVVQAAISNIFIPKSFRYGGGAGRQREGLKLGPCPEHSLTTSTNIDDPKNIPPFDMAAAAPGALGRVPHVHIPPEYLYQGSRGSFAGLYAKASPYGHCLSETCRNLLTFDCNISTSRDGHRPVPVNIVDHDTDKLRIFIAAVEEAFDDGMKPTSTLIPVRRLAGDDLLMQIHAVAILTE